MSGTVSSMNLGAHIESRPHPNPYIILPKRMTGRTSNIEMKLPMNAIADAPMNVFRLPNLTTLPPRIAPMVVPKMPLLPRRVL